ncbi:MAG: PspC domain-containing protein [Dehalococcoidia bacterium]
MPEQTTLPHPHPIDLDQLGDEPAAEEHPPLEDLRGPAPEPPAEPAVRTLRRSCEDRMLGGVCGGLGRYLGIDPVLFRIAFVLLTIGAGSGLLLYVIAWIVIPAQAEGERLIEAPRRETGDMRLLVGGAMVLIGAGLLAQRVMPWFDERVVWPLVIIAIGALVALKGVRR